MQWDVLALGSAHHTFHVHGHRWRGPNQVRLDTRTIGPAESFRVRWKENEPGTWLYHCHREDHMERGMIGLYKVAAASKAKPRREPAPSTSVGPDAHAEHPGHDHG